MIDQLKQLLDLDPWDATPEEIDEAQSAVRVALASPVCVVLNPSPEAKAALFSLPTGHFAPLQPGAGQ
jgi:hypothetical protein